MVYLPTVPHKNQPIHVGKYTIYMDPIWVLMHLLLYSWHVHRASAQRGGVFPRKPNELRTEFFKERAD